MSLVTLKNKSNVVYNCMSVNRKQFSLNGFYRNDRSLPSTNRIQTSIPRTLARGNQLRGYGGCCGKFKISIISPLCELPFAEQPETLQIKLSTKNTSGLIATKYLWTKLPNPYTWVKRQNSPLNTSSQLYTDNLSKNTISNIISIDNTNSSTLNQCNFTKSQSSFTSIPQSNFLLKLSGNCVNNVNNSVYNLPTNFSNLPIIGSF